jgi:hypothetical protein
VKQFKDLFDSYEDTKPFAKRFEFHEINYNKVFEAWREKWKELSTSAAAAAKALNITSGIAKELINLSGAPAGDGFLRTHILDVALYRLARPITEEVMLVVNDKIREVFEKPAKAGRPIEYSIIAHSLGTVVAYEAFHANLSGKSPLPPSARPNNVFMVANTAAALWQRGPNIYLPEMAPNLRSDKGWCYRMANFGHRLDPVARLRPFDPPDAWFDTGTKDETYMDVWLRELDVQSFNVHALSHYLSHPSVHIPILRHLVSSHAISPSVEMQAIEDWRRQRDDIFKRQAAATLGDILLKSSPNFMDQLKQIKLFRELVLGSSNPKPDGES